MSNLPPGFVLDGPAPAQSRQADPIVKPAPRPAEPTPFEAERQQWSREDQARQNERQERDRAVWNARYNPDGTEKPKPVDKPAAYSQSALDSFDRAIESGNRLLTHPGYGAAVGSGLDPQSYGSYVPFVSPNEDGTRAISGTSARGFEAELSAMKAQLFLPMVQSMKGLGALSNAEGQKLTAAVGALDPGMSEADFKASVDRILGDLKMYRDRYAGQAPRQDVQPSTAIDSTPVGGSVPPAGGPTPSGPPDNGPTFKPDGSVSFGKDNYKGDFVPGGGTTAPMNAAEGESYSTANDLAYAAAMQEAYNKGGSVQDLLGIARQYGFDTDIQKVSEWQDAVDYREGQGRFEGQRRGLSQVSVPQTGTRSLIEQGMGSVAKTGPGAALISAGDVASFGTLDELVGASRAAANGTDYTNERDYANFAKQATMEESPWWSAGGMLLGGAGQAASLGKVGVNALAKFAPAASAKLAGLGAAGQAATSGAVQGGLYGAGTENENRLLGATLGAGLGGGLGALAGKGAQALASRGRPATGLVDEAAPFIGAAQRQDVPIREPDINPGVRGNAGALGQSEKGGPIIGAAMADDAAAVEAGVARAGGTGTANDRFGTGELVQGVLTRQGDTTRTAARSQYERAERLSGDPAIEPTIAIKKLADEIVALEANPNTNAAEIKLLTGLGEDLSAPGGKRISDLRAMRSNIRTQLRAAGLDRTPAEARALGIIDAASADIEQGLVNNPAALAAYKKGDQIWRERAQFRQDITRRLMGTRDRPFSPEETGRAVESLVKSDGKRTMTLLSEMQPAERLDFAASIASNLGRNAKGDFSLPILLNNLDTRRGIVSPRATAVVFGKEGAEALKDLRLIAQTKLEGQSARNSSNTGGVVSRNTKGLRTALFTAMGYGSGGITGAVVAPMAERFMANLGEERAARLLMNPNLTKWIRNAPNSAEPAVINRHFERLSSLANRNLIASADIEAFKNAMVQSVANSPGRAAAQDEADSGRKPPQ